VVVVRSFELDDKNAVVQAIARIAKYLVGREKQRAVKADTSWFDRVEAEGAVAPAGKQTARIGVEADETLQPASSHPRSTDSEPEQDSPTRRREVNSRTGGGFRSTNQRLSIAFGGGVTDCRGAHGGRGSAVRRDDGRVVQRGRCVGGGSRIGSSGCGVRDLRAPRAAGRGLRP
jgi:hypothetical protein